MSSTGTISDLQQALNCAGKCDCCEKLQQQINQLQNKTNALDQDIKNIIPRVNSHESRISKNEREILSIAKGKGNQNNDNLTKQQLQQLKQQISAIERYINALDGAGKQLNSILRGFSKIFSAFK